MWPGIIDPSLTAFSVWKFEDMIGNCMSTRTFWVGYVARSRDVPLLFRREGSFSSMPYSHAQVQLQGSITSAALALEFGAKVVEATESQTSHASDVAVRAADACQLGD